ncbi:MAG: hypothetical protein JXA44_11155 [Methanospirillaceae archaeon]|nr:hypothetical protein [Methanospirillaceae archaeon]
MSRKEKQIESWIDTHTIPAGNCENGSMGKFYSGQKKMRLYLTLVFLMLLFFPATLGSIMEDVDDSFHPPAGIMTEAILPVMQEGYRGPASAANGSVVSPEPEETPLSCTIYTITATTTRGGIIKPEGVTQVREGMSICFSIIPDSGYYCQGVFVDGIPKGVITEYLFSHVSSDHAIHAIFAPEERYTLTPVPSMGGSIAPFATRMVHAGDSVTFTITADDCYTITDIRIDYSINLGPQESPFVYTFEKVQRSHYIQPVFTRRTPCITATARTGGSIMPPGTTTVPCGWSQSYHITPVSGYYIDTVLVDTVPVGAVSSYTFFNVTMDHTIHALFTRENPGPDFYLVLAPGWNCISIPKRITAGSDTLQNLFSTLESDGHSIYTYDATGQNWLIPPATKQVLPLEAYWVFTAKAENIPIQFIRDSPGSVTLLMPGWNMIGYTGTEPEETRLFFASIPDAWEVLVGYDAGIQAYTEPVIRGGTGPNSDTRLLYPGSGYWLLCNRITPFPSPF